MSVGMIGLAECTSVSVLAAEVAMLRRRAADLEMAWVEARNRDAVMRLAMLDLGYELNGPLSVLVSRIDLMQLEAEELTLPRSAVEDLAVLQRHVERLGRIVRVMLTHAETGHAARAPIDLNGVVREAVGVAVKPFEQQGVRVHLALDEALPAVPGDPVALGQVVMNLLLNAREAMPAGGAVWIETACSNDRSPGVRFLIRDTGPAIPDAIRETLWEPFHTTKSNGRGLGFWIIRSIVQDHEGTIELRPSTGEGTTWVIHLPGREGRG